MGVRVQTRTPLTIVALALLVHRFRIQHLLKLASHSSKYYLADRKEILKIGYKPYPKTPLIELMKRLLIKLSLLLVIGIASLPLALAQNPDQLLTQTVRGNIVDQISGSPLADVGVRIEKGNFVGTGVTDPSGFFRIEEVPVGRVALFAGREGYLSFSMTDLVVNSGKEVVLSLRLEERLYQVADVEIVGESNRAIERVSARTFTVEETQRYAATYYDPARMAASFPGVATVNDENNNIVVRGNSPNGLLWRLEGVDIVNPNHLTNAGTFSDRLTQSGGGQIILSTQLLANSSFYSGAFDANYGNALSGVFDINLRPGNNETFEFTFQPSLIGIDFAAEGPINKEKGSSFVANYRYSTVGLFSAVGLELTPEEINYQDLSFNLTLPTAKAGTFTLFGMGGLSITRYNAPRADSLRLEGRDRFDIDFYSNMGAIGATHQLVLGTRTLWKSALALSGIESQRTGDYITDSFTSLRAEEDFLSQRKLSFTTGITHKLTAKSHLRAGLFVTDLGYSVDNRNYALDSTRAENILAQASGNSQLVQPYASWNYQPSAELEINAGLHAMYFALNGSMALEPRASVAYRPTSRQKLSLAYGLHSQLQMLSTYFSGVELENGGFAFPNEGLGFTRAHHVVMSYQYRPTQSLKLQIEPYYQALFNVPIAKDPMSTFSAINLLEGYVTDSLTNEGTGRNYGVELSAEKTIDNGTYFLLSGSLYDSKYTAADGIERNTRYNGNYLFSGTAGKEFERLTKKGKAKTWGINLRMIYQGGLRYTPIDLDASIAQQRTVFDESMAWSEQLPNYFRTDVRVSFKRQRANLTRTFAIDILNLTNQQNLAFQRFDIVQQAVVDKYSLGLFPLMSYRLEF